jgi:hypothetical protein
VTSVADSQCIHSTYNCLLYRFITSALDKISPDILDTEASELLGSSDIDAQISDGKVEEVGSWSILREYTGEREVGQVPALKDRSLVQV